MSRGKDLIGVLKGVKSVGKKVAKTKKADLDNLVRGTSLQETVDGVAVTLSRIVKAVDQMQKGNASERAKRSSEEGADERGKPSVHRKTKSDTSEKFLPLRDSLSQLSVKAICGDVGKASTHNNSFSRDTEHGPFDPLPFNIYSPIFL